MLTEFPKVDLMPAMRVIAETMNGDMADLKAFLNGNIPGELAAHNATMARIHACKGVIAIVENATKSARAKQERSPAQSPVIAAARGAKP